MTPYLYAVIQFRMLEEVKPYSDSLGSISLCRSGFHKPERWFILNNSIEMKKYTVIPPVDTVKVRKEPPYEE